MSELERHALLRSDLAPHLIYRTARDRDDRYLGPQQVTSHVSPVRGFDEPGMGVSLHEPAPWRCPCGAALEMDYKAVPREWAAHAAKATGIDEEVLLAHMLVSVAGHRPLATCACGSGFLAPDADPLNGDAAVTAWAMHVESVAA